MLTQVKLKRLACKANFIRLSYRVGYQQEEVDMQIVQKANLVITIAAFIFVSGIVFGLIG